MMSTAQKSDFQDRIARIAAGQGCTKATVFVGQDFRFDYTPRSRRKAQALGGTVRNAGQVLMFPVGLAAGFLSHVVERYVHWIFAGVSEQVANVDMEMLRIAAAGMALAIVLTHLVGLRDRSLLVPKILGVVLGMLFFHNFVHAYPGLFEQVFSPLWVAKVTAVTEPASLYFRGVSFTF